MKYLIKLIKKYKLLRKYKLTTNQIEIDLHLYILMKDDIEFLKYLRHVRLCERSCYRRLKKL